MAIFGRFRFALVEMRNVTLEQFEQRVRKTAADLRVAGFKVSLDQRIPSDAAAALIGISPGTIRNWRCAGVGPDCEFVRGRIWYAIAEVLRWKDAQARHYMNA